ncbi:MAG: hypothetical protein AAB897_03785 [Patescibacteria group bacterium]
MPVKKIALSSVIIIVIVFATWAGIFYWQNLRGFLPGFLSPSQDIVESINTTGMPLKLPPGFGIEIFAKDLPGVRVLPTRMSFS